MVSIASLHSSLAALQPHPFSRFALNKRHDFVKFWRRKVGTERTPMIDHGHLEGAVWYLWRVADQQESLRKRSGPRGIPEHGTRWATCCKILLYSLFSILQGMVTPIRTLLTAKTGVKKFWPSLYCLTAWPHCKNYGSWLFDRTGNQLMTVDYTHILSFDPIIYRRKQSNSTPSLVYGVKMPGLSC